MCCRYSMWWQQIMDIIMLLLILTLTQTITVTLLTDVLQVIQATVISTLTFYNCPVLLLALHSQTSMYI